MVLLCILLIILIAVISSERIRKVIGSFSEKFIFRFIPALLGWVLFAVVIVTIGYLLRWVWNTFCKPYLNLPSFGEMCKGIGILLLIIIPLWLLGWLINIINSKLKKKYGVEKVEKFYEKSRTITRNLFIDVLFFVVVLSLGGILEYLFSVSKYGRYVIIVAVSVYLVSYFSIKYYFLPLNRRKKEELKKITGR